MKQEEKTGYRMTPIKMLFVLCFVTCFGVGAEAANDRPLTKEEKRSLAYVGLEVYSDLKFNADAGDWYGLQIVIVPYTGGTKLLWRSGGPKLDEPLLLDASESGNTFKVIVPDDSDFFGEWVLTVKGTVLEAVGPRDIKFNLVKLPSK